MGLPQGFSYEGDFLRPEAADSLLKLFEEELHWQHMDIVLFGRKVAQPRLTAWYADSGVRYAYSGLPLDPLPWHPALLKLRKRLQEHLGTPFNSVLCNAYRDGQDSMGWHADNEPELGSMPVIASLSLGAVRRFRIRSVDKSVSQGMDLGHGSLLVMSQASQRDYRHALPKTARNISLRINLTFRQVY
jgi:alkylated DNA repair dioxygenase AlkB